MSNKKKEIRFIVQLDASDFPGEVEEEMTDHDISTHYQDDTCHIEWGCESWKETEKWLLDTYGEEIMNYETFAISAT